MSQKGLYKKYDRNMTAWDFTCKYVNNATPARRKIKKRIRRIARKKLNAADFM